MSSVHQPAYCAASGNTVIIPTFLPFLCGAEMEALQLQAGVLRALKLEHLDEQSEHRYRQSVYITYDAALSAFTNTNDSTFNACIAINTDVAHMDHSMTNYVRMLQELDNDLDRRPLADSLPVIMGVTRDFETIQYHSFARFRLATMWLHEDHEEVRTAYNKVYAVMDSSSQDNILNMEEALRLLCHLQRREQELRAAAEQLEAQIQVVWDVLVGQCDLAVQSLRTSGLRGEAGLDELCNWLEFIGEDAGNVEVRIERRPEDWYEEEEDRGEMEEEEEREEEIVEEEIVEEEKVEEEIVEEETVEEVEREREEDRGQDNFMLEG
jgi:hypothetical protein